MNYPPHLYLIRKINSADCVNMDCDAKKKCMVKDLDGTLLGAVGAVLPQSEVLISNYQIQLQYMFIIQIQYNII